MTDPQHLLTAAFGRLSDQFAHATAGDIQTGLQRAIEQWQQTSPVRSDSFGALSRLGTARNPPDDHLHAAPSNPQADQFDEQRLLTTLQQRMVALQRPHAGQAAPQRVFQPTSHFVESQTRTPINAANAISRIGEPADSIETPARAGSSLRTAWPDTSSQRPSNASPGDIAQRMNQSADQLLAHSGPSGFAATPQSPDPAIPAAAGRLESLAMQIQMSPPVSPGPAGDTTSARTIDRLRDAALSHLDPGATLMPFRDGLAAAAIDRSIDNRIATTSSLAEHGPPGQSPSRMGPDEYDPRNAVPRGSQSAAASLPPPVVSAPDPHQTALAMIHTLKTDARWNNQPTDVLKPLR